MPSATKMIVGVRLPSKRNQPIRNALTSPTAIEAGTIPQIWTKPALLANRADT